MSSLLYPVQLVYGMKDDDTYLTLSNISEGIFKDKGSKFISYAHPISSESQVAQIINSYKKEHNTARHHCYAYKIGVHSVKYRQNDDGEPSGTAGKPIYGQILSHELTNILIVVVRYFGGTLLGTGGLIYAYKSAAAQAIENGEIVPQTLKSIFHIKYNYDNTSDINRFIKQFNAKEIESTYTSICEQKIAVRQSMADAFYNKISSLENVSIQLNKHY